MKQHKKIKEVISTMQEAAYIQEVYPSRGSAESIAFFVAPKNKSGVFPVSVVSGLQLMGVASRIFEEKFGPQYSGATLTRIVKELQRHPNGRSFMGGDLTESAEVLRMCFPTTESDGEG